MVFTKWHGKRDVNILSTNCDPLDPPVIKERQRKNGEITQVEKLACVELYNKHMGSMDCLDQLCSYYSTSLFWFIFVAICNSYILFKEIVQRPGRGTMVDFRLALGKQLIAGISS